MLVTLLTVIVKYKTKQLMEEEEGLFGLQSVVGSRGHHHGQEQNNHSHISFILREIERK